jgi:hypothetical protein
MMIMMMMMMMKYITWQWWSQYIRESVNRSQMDIKRKTCDIQTWKKAFISQHPPPTLMDLSHRFIFASKPTAQTVVSATSAYLFQPLRHERSFCHEGGFLGDQTDGTH